MIENNRKQKINSFLKRIEWICSLYNYDYETLKRIVYNELHNIGITNPHQNVENMFSHWINNNNRSATNVFQSQRFKYFCQFIKEEYPNQVIKESDPVKLYIPVDANHLYESVNRIFNFCEQNNIIHTSKVAKEIRNDNVVLRVRTRDDALKIINYVNSDPYILEGRLEVNPFCINADGVGLAVDNYNSYNMQVASYITKYTLFNKEHNLTHKISCDDFSMFVSRVPLEYQDCTDLIYKEEIRSLIVKSLNSSDVNTLFDHHSKVSGNSIALNQVNNSQQDDYSKVLAQLESVINVTIENHNIGFAMLALKEYLQTGRLEGFSRFAKDNGVPDKTLNYRELLRNYDFKFIGKVLANHTHSSNIDDIANIYFSSFQNGEQSSVR